MIEGIKPIDCIAAKEFWEKMNPDTPWSSLASSKKDKILRDQVACRQFQEYFAETSRVRRIYSYIPPKTRYTLREQP